MARATRVPTEAQILRSILDYLAARRILYFRMNVLAMPTADGKRFVKAGTPGMADVLAFPIWHDCGKAKMGSVMWIECKTQKGKQSVLQALFQKQVQDYGHQYLIARSIEDVEAALQ